MTSVRVSDCLWYVMNKKKYIISQSKKPSRGSNIYEGDIQPLFLRVRFVTLTKYQGNFIIKCSCKGYDNNGIACGHIIHVMEHKLQRDMIHFRYWNSYDFYYMRDDCDEITEYFNELRDNAILGPKYCIDTASIAKYPIFTESHMTMSDFEYILNSNVPIVINYPSQYIQDIFTKEVLPPSMDTIIFDPEEDLSESDNNNNTSKKRKKVESNININSQESKISSKDKNLYLTLHPILNEIAKNTDDKDKEWIKACEFHMNQLLTMTYRRKLENSQKKNRKLSNDVTKIDEDNKLSSNGFQIKKYEEDQVCNSELNSCVSYMNTDKRKKDVRKKSMHYG